MVTYEAWEIYETDRADCTVYVKRHLDGGSSWRAVDKPTQAYVFASFARGEADADALLPPVLRAGPRFGAATEQRATDDAPDTVEVRQPTKP